WCLAARRIDDGIDLLVFDHIEHMRAPLTEFEQPVRMQSGGGQSRSCTAGRVDSEAEINQFFCQLHDARLVRVFDAEEYVAATRQGWLRRHLRFCVGESQVFVYSHNLTGRFHFRSERDVDAWESYEWEDGLLNRIVAGQDFAGKSQFMERFSCHHL